MLPIVTILLPTYNRPEMLRESLASIFVQTFQEYNVFVIDNGSTPPAKLPKAISKDPRFHLYRIDDNDSRAVFSLDLTRKIKTKYAGYLFDDDQWEPEKLEKQIAFLESHPDTVACFTHAVFIGDMGETLNIKDDENVFLVKNRTRGEWAQHFFFRGNCLCQPSAIINTGKLIEALGASPFRQLSDFSVWLNLLAKGNLHVIQEPLTRYRWSSTGSNESNISTPGARNRLNYENSRILHQFRNLPHDVLCSAFKIPANSNQNDIDSAIYNAALGCARNPYYRFAAELSEQLYNTHFLENEHQTAMVWAKRFDRASSSPPDPEIVKVFQSIEIPLSQYQKRLAERSVIETDRRFIDKTIDAWGSSAPTFHLLLRIAPQDSQLLADTLDTLNQQVYNYWHLDIFTTLATPEGLQEVTCLSWHTINAQEEMKEVIDFVVTTRKLDWLIELPAGARLDPLFLWRLAHEASTSSANAFFVDDDCCNNSGERFNPRFKPGINPAALLGADLAGPICVNQEAWQTTGGATQKNGSPWFALLLRITDSFGWETIKHIPDILISYPDSFPSDTESCMIALILNFQHKEIKSEIVPVTNRTWGIRYPLKKSPTISIAILSTGQLDLLSRCFTSIIEKTDYQNFEIIIVLTNFYRAPDLDTWLTNAEQTNKPKVRIIWTEIDGNHATRCNAAAIASSSDFLLFLKEETVIIQEKWLEELIRTAAQPGIGGVSPRMIQPGSTLIENAGSTLGLNGIIGFPYQGKTKLGKEIGYLDCIHVARDVTTLPAACMLIRKESYVNAGGMDETDLGNHLAEADLSLKIRKNGERLIYQPLSNIVSSDPKEAVFDIDPSHVATQMLSEAQAKQAFFERWYPEAAVDPFWNPALSLATSTPEPELEFHARWQTIPSDLPRILAHALPNGQGDYRVTSPLNALSKAGMVSECIWRQRTKGEPRFNSVSEIVRLNPDSIIVQSYIITPALAALQEWEASGCRPFTVYAQDDLITDMDASNPFRKDIPANARARLQYALKRCDRLVVSTDFLAEAYRNFVPDIRVVPNRLEQAPWLPLRSLRRTSEKPRIGWAGGTTHQGDLLLLKEIIEKTRDEADWVFFGMCPDEIRPLIAEYHGLVEFSEYPAYLASLNLDLAVAPLAQTPFNRGKSNLRLLEYGILGIPVVCTEIEPYQNSPACRVNNTVAEWTEAVRVYINEPEVRAREGDAMRRWVLENYLLENHLEEWLDAHLPS